MFSIRGKSKNSYRSSEAKVLENVELRNLVAALGLYDGLDGLRYNQVIVASDADDDGMHIRMLLVTFFLKYYIDLIKAGHLYILETPLFRVKTKKRNRYCYSQEERDAAVAEFSKEKVEITRSKVSVRSMRGSSGISSGKTCVWFRSLSMKRRMSKCCYRSTWV